MEFTDQAALLYLQEGMVFSQLSAMGIDNKPSSRQAIINHPFLMMYLLTWKKLLMMIRTIVKWPKQIKTLIISVMTLDSRS